jgi:uncharacterized membrane protein
MRRLGAAAEGTRIRAADEQSWPSCKQWAALKTSSAQWISRVAQGLAASGLIEADFRVISFRKALICFRVVAGVLRRERWGETWASTVIDLACASDL